MTNWRSPPTPTWTTATDIAPWLHFATTHQAVWQRYTARATSSKGNADASGVPPIPSICTTPDEPEQAPTPTSAPARRPPPANFLHHARPLKGPESGATGATSQPRPIAPSPSTPPTHMAGELPMALRVRHSLRLAHPQGPHQVATLTSFVATQQLFSHCTGNFPPRRSPRYGPTPHATPSTTHP